MMTADAQNPEIDPIASQTAEKAEFEQGTQQGDEAIGPGEEIVEVEVEEEVETLDQSGQKVTRKVRRKRRVAKTNAAELRLQGRKGLCKSLAEIAPNMLKTVKLRVLGRYLDSTRGLEDNDLTEIIKRDAEKLSSRTRIEFALKESDTTFDRGQLRSMILGVLLQEESYSIEENRLDEKVIVFEKEIVEKASAFSLDDLKKSDPDRWHQIDTYRIVLEAAFQDDNKISDDEGRLLAVLRDHLEISWEDHWILSAALKKFPKTGCAVHTADEINDIRKEMQRQGILWSYRDENNKNLDIFPGEIALVLREKAGIELQRTNYRRLLSHDGIKVSDLREILVKKGLEKSGAKQDLIERLCHSSVGPKEVLGFLDKETLSKMSGTFGLKQSGAKADVIDRLIAFYDDLTFEERITKDEREVFYANYEFLANRSYAELRAKKIIAKDLHTEHLFEDATGFLFDVKLKVPMQRATKENRADGKLNLEGNQCILLDCKSVETAVNLQDHLESQFDGYLRKEREAGGQPLAFFVIGPAFTPNSLNLAYQYKARTNWDIALITAEGLKYLAERWSAMAPEKPFPVRLLNRTEIIDKDRAEFLLSLA
jgi:hypothetical protein